MTKILNKQRRAIWLCCVGFFCIVSITFGQTTYTIERTLNVKQAYSFANELGIKANASDGKVEVRMYAKDYYTTGGRGDMKSLLYGAYTNSNSTISYDATAWDITYTNNLCYIPVLGNFICIFSGGPFYTEKSTKYKDRVMQVTNKLSAIPDGGGGFVFFDTPKFQVIIELEVSGSTTLKDVMSVKLPGVGEITGLEFRGLPPGHACIGQTTAECETLREFRHGDFEKAIVTAHRGFWGYGDIPEVTMVGLKNAYNNNYVSVEIDILQTKDEELVLMHDQAVNRMTSLPDTYEGCFNDNTNSNSFQRTDAAWLKNLNYNTTTSNVELADHTIQSSYPAVSTGHYVDRRGEVNYNAPLAKLEDALDYIQNKPILLSLDIKEQDEDSYLNTLKKCIEVGKAKGVLHKMVFKPGSAARIPYQNYKNALEAAGLWEDFAKKSNVIVILFHPKDDLKKTVPKEEVDGWISLPSLVCFEFIYKYSNPDNENEVFDAILQPWLEYGNKSVIQYVKERGYRTGINWEIATECRGLPNGRGQWYDRGAPEYQHNILIGIDTRNNPEWLLYPPGNGNAPGAIVTDRPDITQTLLELLGRYNTHSKRN